MLNLPDYLNKDLKSIRSSKNVLVFADKSTNLYELLHDNITQRYKKTLKNTKRDVDRKISYVKVLKIEEKMECYSGQHTARIT